MPIISYLNQALSLVNVWIPGAWLSEHILHGSYSAFDTLFPSLLYTLAIVDLVCQWLSILHNCGCSWNCFIVLYIRSTTVLLVINTSLLTFRTQHTQTISDMSVGHAPWWYGVQLYWDCVECRAQGRGLHVSLRTGFHCWHSGDQNGLKWFTDSDYSCTWSSPSLKEGS